MIDAIEIRHASPAERKGTIRSQWWRAIMPPKGPPLVAHHRRGLRVTKVTARRMAELYVDDVLEDPDTTVLVAVLPSTPREILGWVVFDRQALHFVRVVTPYGLRGIGRSLLLQVPPDREAQWEGPGSHALLVSVARARGKAGAA